MKERIQIHDQEKCYNGYTLFCHPYPEEAVEEGEGKIHLIDMEGNTVHTWYTETTVQSHCHLLPNGNLLYPTRDRSDIQKAGLRELDPESNVQWYYHCRVDHDFQVLSNGNYLIHTVDDHMVPELSPGLKANPYILEINRQQELIWEWRAENHIDDLKRLLSPEEWEHVQDRLENEYPFDWAHNNTCQVIRPNATYEKELKSDGPVRFKPGNIVFSYRSNDVIGVIDRENGDIVWAWGPGRLDGQHHPHILSNGNLLIFDNGTLRGYSRVIELNPLSNEIEWEYVADPKEEFHSKYISGAQRLPNGNTLICDGMESRLFEVTREGEMVWEYTSHLHEESANDTIYRATRYSPDYVETLFESL